MHATVFQRAIMITKQDQLTKCYHFWVNSILKHSIIAYYINIIPKICLSNTCIGHDTYNQPSWGNKSVYDYAMGQAGMSACFPDEKVE